MSKKKILAKFKAKRIEVESIEFVRGEPTPSGYASGWDIMLSERSEDALFSLGATVDSPLDFANTAEAIAYIESLPSLKVRRPNE